MPSVGPVASSSESLAAANRLGTDSPETHRQSVTVETPHRAASSAVEVQPWSLRMRLRRRPVVFMQGLSARCNTLVTLILWIIQFHETDSRGRRPENPGRFDGFTMPAGEVDYHGPVKS
jgi:hypothetical protein